MATKLTFFNHAGGAMKTSLTRDIGYTLAQRGERVLLVDLDPQASLSMWLGVRGAAPEQTVLDMAVGDRDDLPSPIRVHDLDLIPSHMSLALAEARMVGLLRGTERLAEALKAVDKDYDFIFMDSPPSLGQLSVMAALAADKIIVPIPTRQKGLDALFGLDASLKQYKRARPDLEVGLYIPTFYNARRAHDREVLTELQARLTPLASPIPQREAVWLDSNSVGQPVGLYAPSSPVAADVAKVTDELVAALGVG